LLDVIANIEKGASKEDVSFVDITPIGSSSMVQRVPYLELVAKLNEIESQGERISKEKPRQVQPHLVTAGLAQAAYSQPQVIYKQKPEAAAEHEMPAAQQPAAEAKPVVAEAPKEVQAAKAELSGIVRKIGAVAKMPKIKVKRINVSELVLPNLTLADQIAELERIIEGLNEHVFDSEHLAIVVEELEGLNQVIEDAKKKKKIAPKSDLERSLFELRDQRLAEALALLKVNS